jgi:hypothetical protein
VKNRLAPKEMCVDVDDEQPAMALPGLLGE